MSCPTWPATANHLRQRNVAWENDVIAQQIDKTSPSSPAALHPFKELPTLHRQPLVKHIRDGIGGE